MLQPSGMEVLQQLECDQRVIQETQQIDSLYCQTTSSKVLIDLHYKDVKKGLFGCGTQRAAFLKILLDVCQKDGVEIIWGCDIQSIALEKTNVSSPLPKALTAPTIWFSFVMGLTPHYAHSSPSNNLSKPTHGELYGLLANAALNFHRTNSGKLLKKPMSSTAFSPQEPVKTSSVSFTPSLYQKQIISIRLISNNGKTPSSGLLQKQNHFWNKSTPPSNFKSLDTAMSFSPAGTMTTSPS